MTTHGPRQVRNVNCARSPKRCWSLSSRPCSPGSVAQGAPAHLAHPPGPDYARFCSMHFSLLRCLGSAQQDTSGMWWCCDTQEPWIWLQHLHGRWEDHRCLSGTLVSEQSGLHAGHGLDFGACTFLHIVSSCHEVIPGGTKATIVGVDEDGDLPVFTDDGKMMATWCSIWLQVWERQCRPLIPTSPTLQRQKSDDQTTLNNSCAKSSNVLLQTRWLLCRSTMEH